VSQHSPALFYLLAAPLVRRLQYCRFEKAESVIAILAAPAQFDVSDYFRLGALGVRVRAGSWRAGDAPASPAASVDQDAAQAKPVSPS